MNVKKIYALTLVVSVVFSAFVLFNRNPKQSINNTLILGTATGYAPFVSTNLQGELEGFDIDVAQALANKMLMPLEIKDLGSMAMLFTALDQEKIDAIIWGLDITQDRLKKVSMVHYRGQPTIAEQLIFWEKIPAGVQKISDLKGATICVEPASAQDALVSKYSFINKLPVEKIDDALLNIQYGKADAAIVDLTIAKKFKRKYPQIQTLTVPLALEDQIQGIGIAIKQSNFALTQKIQNALSSLKADGTIAQLEQKWGLAS